MGTSHNRKKERIYMADKKKLLTSVAAIATSAALVLGGTFAWQSINQTALNEASDVVNPGGRLHNDLWYETATTTNSDVYVENFADEDIFARVRLSEYMEIVMNYDPTNPNAPQTKVETVVGSKTLKADGSDGSNMPSQQDMFQYEYATHYFGETTDDEGNVVDTNATDKYWTWDTDGNAEGAIYYMPTFNLNKDSLAPDLNGMYVERVGGISNRIAAQYDDYTVWADGNDKTAYEIYDGDVNDADEIGIDPAVLADLIANGTQSTSYNEDAIVIPGEQAHVAAAVGASKGLISLTDWLALVGYDEATGEAANLSDGANYWVYDDTADEDGDGTPDGDGWVYWASPIAEGTATGLLLDSFTLKDVMDDTWYYAIEVTGQFITADDLGEPAAGTYGLRNSEVGGTGFYRGGETVTDNALELLRLIGVDVDGETGGNEGGNEGGNGSGNEGGNGSGNEETYSISFGDKKAIIGSADSEGLPVSLLNSEDATVTENVTWTVTDGKAAVVDGSVKAADAVTMSAVLEKLTLSASVDGEVVASADLYMYDASQHVMYGDYHIVTLESGNTYCMLDAAVSTYIQMDEVSGCVWKYGDDVKAIYQYTHTMHVSYPGLAEVIEEVIYNNGEPRNDFSYTDCPHLSSYESGGEP